MPKRPVPPPPPSKAVGDETPPQGGVSSMAGVEVGLRLVVAVMLMGGIGFALDRYLGSLPWLMMLGGVLGFVSWIVSVARRPRA